jgi:predicted SAM-dependent methyltransferase
MSLFVQYGCGLSAPEQWKNFDASPTLRLQKIPLIGFWARKKVNFPQNVLYGDILKGLPGVQPNSCDAVYCSHTLEHLSLYDCGVALKNTYAILKPGGIFRCVLPDLEFFALRYLEDKKTRSDASMRFMQSTMLGVEQRNRSLKNLLFDFYGNSSHLWMWDDVSLTEALQSAGFTSIRKCAFNDSNEKAFLAVEEESRFWGALALECIK